MVNTLIIVKTKLTKSVNLKFLSIFSRLHNCRNNTKGINWTIIGKINVKNRLIQDIFFLKPTKSWSMPLNNKSTTQKLVVQIVGQLSRSCKLLLSPSEVMYNDVECVSIYLKQFKDLKIFIFWLFLKRWNIVSCFWTQYSFMDCCFYCFNYDCFLYVSLDVFDFFKYF